jgi:hypothetical protein
VIAEGIATRDPVIWHGSGPLEAARGVASLARNPPGREHGAVQIVAGQITVAELSAMAEATFGDLVKAVADVRRGLLAVDAGMHSDLQALLLDAGASQAAELVGRVVVS